MFYGERKTYNTLDAWVCTSLNNGSYDCAQNWTHWTHWSHSGSKVIITCHWWPDFDKDCDVFDFFVAESLCWSQGLRVVYKVCTGSHWWKVLIRGAVQTNLFWCTKHWESHHSQVEELSSTMTLPRTGCASKIDKKTRRKSARLPWDLQQH